MRIPGAWRLVSIAEWLITNVYDSQISAGARGPAPTPRNNHRYYLVKYLAAVRSLLSVCVELIRQ